MPDVEENAYHLPNTNKSEAARTSTTIHWILLKQPDNQKRTTSTPAAANGTRSTTRAQQSRPRRKWKSYCSTLMHSSSLSRSRSTWIILYFGSETNESTTQSSSPTTRLARYCSDGRRTRNRDLHCARLRPSFFDRGIRATQVRDIDIGGCLSMAQKGSGTLHGDGEDFRIAAASSSAWNPKGPGLLL
jgi:hypothetical protein